jgi:crotonobetainyl-CoA:carnitine CoA-transferase CaiB-like acyl-CoA transferase
MTAGPLAGIKVVEWAHVHFGPGAGMFLSDMGAEVIHVETRDGDMMRYLDSMWGNTFLVGPNKDRNTFTEDLLRNKRSITVDLSKPEAQEIIYKLVADADVFITNYRPVAGRKLGMDYETLKRVNPSLIYAQGTSYGDEGADKDAPGLEMMGLARSGLMLGSAVEGEAPVYPTMGISDRLGSIGLLAAILAGLVAKERTGVAQYISTSLLGWAVNLQAVSISCAVNTDQPMRPLAREDQDDANYNVYRLKDGTWTALGMMPHPTKYWPLLCQAINRPDLVTDPKFHDLASRRINNHELIKILDEVFAEITWEEWDKAISQYELIACRVNTFADLTTDEQVLANRYLAKLPHKDLDSWWYVPTPIHFSETPVQIRAAAPSLGEHTDEVLAEVGYSEEQIQHLHAEQVV